MTGFAPVRRDSGPDPAPGAALLVLALLAALSVGLFARNFWTPDEPREADLAWRMSMQADKAVPLLAGVPYCEKPPLTYWMAGGAIALFGFHPWVARLPNLFYALLATLAVAALARRAVSARAAPLAAALLATCLLAYQVMIWLATDAPLLAFDTLALLGLWIGYQADTGRARLGGYALMHGALALAFLAKSAAAFMVPALTFLTLCLWERRWRELTRWELYVPLALEAAVILPWIGAVYRGPDGIAHLKVFFWNNLAGRFVHLDAPPALDYTSGHRNTPGKYFIELPMYLFPWTFLVAAAVRRAWQQRHARDDGRIVRFAFASTLPAIVLLSLAATARNIYLAPVLPGCALLVAWWWDGLPRAADRWDAWLVRATAVLLAAAVLVSAAAARIVSADAATLAAALLGVAGATLLLARARRCAPQGALPLMMLAWCVLLIVPAAPIYRQINHWQALDTIGRAVAADTAGRPLILLAPDETTLALIDLYGVRADVRPDGRAGGGAGGAGGVQASAATPSFTVIEAPLDAAALQRLDGALASQPGARALVQLAGRTLTPPLATLARWLHRSEPKDSPPPWAEDPHLTVRARYALPNGRRYALLAGSASN